MARSPREKSKTGIYHIILRGINRQLIFEDEEDADRFLETLGRYRKESGYEIYAYCLMGNHIHILIKEGKEELSLAMKRIGVSYVYWYNLKYDRSGHLFQDRYKSEVVEDNDYLLTVLRYIHQNPLKAKIAEDISTYKWSSYHEYLGNNGFSDKEFILELFDSDRRAAVSKFQKFHKTVETGKCLDLKEKIAIRDDEAIEIIKEALNISRAKDVQKLDVTERNNFLRELKAKGLSTRQISRLTGISRNIVLKV